jgi:hypothetical protein
MKEAHMDPEAAEPAWRYASLKFVQPGWPGSTAATWVAATSDGKQFECADALSGMDRLGADGWLLVLFTPEVGDRPGCFYFKAPRRESP